MTLCLQGSGEKLVSMHHFQEALKVVRPSCLRSSLGRTELSPVSWEQIGGLDDVKLKLRQVFKQQCLTRIKILECCTIHFTSLFHIRVSSGQWYTLKRLYVSVLTVPVVSCSTDPRDVQRRRSSERQPHPPTAPSFLWAVLTSTLLMWETLRRL